MARKLMCEAYKSKYYGSHIVWILRGWYASDWWNEPSNCTPEQILMAAGSYLALQQITFENSTEKTVAGWSANELYEQYLNELQKWNDSETDLKDSYASFGYDSLWVIALALDCTISQLEGIDLSLAQFACTTRDDSKIANMFKERIFSSNFIGMSGRIEFSPSGDRSGKFYVQQMQDRREVAVATFESSIPPRDETFSTYPSDTRKPFRWPGGVPPRDHSCIVTNMVTIDFSLFVVMATVSGIGILLAFLLLGLNLSHQLNRCIQQPSQLNNVFLVGCIACYSCVFLFGAEIFLDEKQTDVLSHLCKCRLWFLTLGFSMTFGSMFVKTWRVYRIFTNKALHKELKYLDDRHLIIMVVILVFIDCAFLVAWQQVSPMKTTVSVFHEISLKENDTTIRYNGFRCGCEYKVVWFGSLYVSKGLLLVFGLFLAWETRNVKFKMLNDSKNIGMSVYNIVIWVCVTIPIELTVVRDEPNASFGVLASAINICTTCTMALVFVPKLRILRNFKVPWRKGEPAGTSSEQTKTAQTKHPSCPYCMSN